MIGSKLAHYEILALLGEGGMGRVYRARDTKLGREVALKILPAEMSGDPDRRMRFDREARAVAALKHPNIVTIHSVEEVESTVFLTMELVEGKTLSELIPEHGMHLDGFFSIAVPLVDAVASAHQKGITHRDLKPANVMLDHGKQLKVLDFGLAKLLEPEVSESETVAEGATAEGRILGTVAYMSPEQAEGKAVDHRSDIFSLGILLYEMATGDKPFKGDTNISTITSILRDDPPSVTDLRQNLPRHLSRVVRRCLAKDPERRYQTALDLRNELLELKEELASGEIEMAAPGGVAPAGGPGRTAERSSAGRSTTGHSTTGSSSAQVRVGDPSSSGGSALDVVVGGAGGRRRLLWGVGAVVGIALVAVAVMQLRPQGGGSKALAPAGQAMRVTRLTNTGTSIEAAISPDGKNVAHVQQVEGRLSLWLTQVSTGSSVQILPESEAVIFDPTFDPPGEFVYYIHSDRGSAVSELRRIPVLGGSPQKILEGVNQTISFSPDGTQFAYVHNELGSSRSMIMAAAVDGSNTRTMATREGPGGGGVFNENPSWSPDGKLLAAPVQEITPDKGLFAYIVLIPAEGGPEKRLEGHSWLGISEIAWLPDQSGLVLAASEGFTGSQLWELSYPGGSVRRITNDVNEYNGVSLTEDGRVLAVGLDEQSFTLQIAEAEGATSTTEIIPGKNRQDGQDIAWTPDGRILYNSLADGSLGVWISGSDGTGARKFVGMSPAAQGRASHDGSFLIFTAISGGVHIWKADRDARNPIQLTHGTFEVEGDLSPDGSWVVYNDAVGNRILRKPVAGGDSVVVSSLPGASTPRVSPDGTRIAFRAYDPQARQTRTYIVPFEGGDPVAVLDIPSGVHNWSLDGNAILYTDEKSGVMNVWSRPVDGGEPRQITRFTEGLIIGFGLSPDGTQLALGRGTSSSDVVLITDFR